MVAVNQIRDEYRLEAKTVGVDQAKAAAEGLATATDKVAASSERQERKVISVQRALERFAAANDQAFRAQQQVERAQALVNRAFEQGLGETLAYQRATVVLSEKQAALARITAQAAAANENNAASMARMRAQYDPAFAAQVRHRTALEGIAEAEKAGAITATLAMQARIAATRAMEDQIQKLERLAQAQKAAAQRQVNQQLIVPDRAADVAAYATEMDRLRAKFDPLFAAQQTYRSNLAELRQALTVGAISEAAYTAKLERRKAAFAEQVRGLGLVSNAERQATAAAQETARATQAATAAAQASAAKARAQGMVSGQTIIVDRGSDIANYGQQLDALRAKYNPLFAAGQAYKAQLAEIGTAARVGAISEAERAAALTRTKNAFAGQVAAIRSTTAAGDAARRSVGLQAHEWQNLSFQVNDAVTMLASGSSAFQVVATQGGQVYQVLSGAQGGISGALGAIKDRLLAISPLVGVFGLLAAGAISAAIAAASYANAQRDVRLALLGIGQAAGLSVEQVDLIARQAAETAKISVAAAREIEAAFLKSGKVYGDVFLQATVAAANFAKATKQDNAQAADFLTANLGNLGSGGYEALAKQAGNFDAALDAQVRSLLDAGREADAQRAVVERFGQAYEKVGQQLTAFDRTLNALKSGFSGVWDAISRATTGAERSSAEVLTITETAIKNRETIAKATNADPASDQQYSTLRERAARLRGEIEKTGEAVRSTSEATRNNIRALDKTAVNAAVPEMASLTQVRENLAKANAELNALENGGGSAERIDAASKAVAALSAAERDYRTAGGAANMERAKANALLAAGLQGLQAVTPAQKAEAARQQALAEAFGTVSTVQERSVKAADAYNRAMAEQRASSDASSRAMDESTRTANEVARATAQTGKSVEYLTATRKVDEQIRAGVFRADEREAKVKEQLQAQLAQVNQQAAQRKRTLDDQASAQEAVNARVAAGTMVSAQATRQVQNEIELRALGRERDAAAGETKTELARRYDELAAAQQRQLSAEDRTRVLSLSEDEDRRLEMLRKEAELLGATTRQRQTAIAVLQAEQDLKKQGISATAPESVAYLDKVRLRSDMEGAKSEYERLAQDIASAVSGIFDDMFKAGNKGIAGFFDSFARGFSRIGTRMLEQNLIAPLLGGQSGFAGGSNPLDAVGKLFDTGGIEKAVNKGSQGGIFDAFSAWLKPAQGADGKATGGFATSKLGSGLMSAGVGASIGYQSQSPLMGAVGGALTGYSMGGPVGGVIGGVAGLLGGIFGKSQAKKEAEKRIKEQLEAYKEAYRQAQPEIEKLRATFRGESIGNVGTAIDGAFQQAYQANVTASKAGDQATADKIMQEFVQYADRLRWQFIRAFEGTLAEVGTGLGTNGPFAQAAAAVTTLGESLKAFVADAMKLPEAESNAARARAAAQEAALASLDVAPTLSETQQRLSQIRGTAAGLTQVLIDLGMSAESAATAIAQRTQKALDDLRDSFNADLDRKIDEASGRDYVNEVRDLLKEVGTLRADQRAVGGDAGRVEVYFDAAAQKIVDGAELTGDAFNALVTQFPELTGRVREFAEVVDGTAAAAAAASRALGYQNRLFAAQNDATTLAGQLAAYDRQAQQEREQEIKDGGQALADLEAAQFAERLKIVRDYQKQAADAERQRMQAATQAFNTFARGIKEYLDGLRAGPTSNLSPADRLAAARSQFDAQLQAARNGDRDALNGITGYASTLLEASKAYNASSPAYQADLKRVTDALAALPKQVSAEQFIVDAIDDSKEAVVDATRVMQETLRTAVAANNPTAVATALNANFAKLDTSVNGLLDFGEFSAGLGPLATKAEQEAAKAIFNAIDTNGDGQLSRLELANASLGAAVGELSWNNTHTVNAAAQAAAHADVLRSAINANNPSLVAAALDGSFTRLDTSVNGLLDYSEFVAGLGPMATRAEQEAARQIFNQIDANGDGQIDKLELVRARTAGVEQQTGAVIPLQQDSVAMLRAINEVSGLQRSQLEALNNQFAYSPFTAPNGVRLDSNLVTALNKIVFNTANTVIGQKSGASYTFARGGYVAGPGTGTSDSIDAQLSNGEFVVTADATRRYGRAMLDAMNDNRLQAPVIPFPVAVGGGESSAAMVAELRALRAEVAALRGEVRENTDVAEQGHLGTIGAVKRNTSAVQEGNATASRQSLARKPKAA